MRSSMRPSIGADTLSITSSSFAITPPAFVKLKILFYYRHWHKIILNFTHNSLEMSVGPRSLTFQWPPLPSSSQLRCFVWIKKLFWKIKIIYRFKWTCPMNDDFNTISLSFGTTLLTCTITWCASVCFIQTKINFSSNFFSFIHLNNTNGTGIARVTIATANNALPNITTQHFHRLQWNKHQK